MEDKLLPCPFCGFVPAMPKEASVYSGGYRPEDFGMTAAIHCKCGVFILGKVLKDTDDLAVQEAARVWNTRAIHPAISS